jgi:lipopolysaccharide heptosyltransferase II
LLQTGGGTAATRRILVLGRSHIGDCLLSTPAIRALRRRFPAASLDVAIPRSNLDLLAANPYLDELIFRPRRGDWAGKMRFARRVRRRGYDLVVSFQEKSLFYGWVARCSNAPHRISLHHPRTQAYYTITVPFGPRIHEVEKYLALARAVGCRVDGTSLDLVTPASARTNVARFLRSQGLEDDMRFVGLTPGATKRQKRWPADRFAEAAAALIGELSLPAVVLGGRYDVRIAHAIAERMPARPIVLAGKTSLAETAALLERCRLLLTNDTGPMHMASALAVPVVAIWGPTSAEKFAPAGTRSTVVRRDEPCPRCVHPCVHAVTVDDVVTAALAQDAAVAGTARSAARAARARAAR